MAARLTRNSRRRTSTNVIDLTCDLDTDSESEVLIVGEEAGPAPRLPSPPVDIVGMHVVVEPAPQHIPVVPPPPPATDYPRNRAEAQLETELSDLAIDLNLMQGYVRERGVRALRSGLQRRLRELRQTHGGLAARVGQLPAGRRRRFEEQFRPLGADLDEVRRLLAEASELAALAADADRLAAAPWQQRDGGGPLRSRRGTAAGRDSPDSPMPPDTPPGSPPRAGPAAAHYGRCPMAPPASPSPDMPDTLQCPVCWESVPSLKAQQRGFLVTRCGHWFCEPCLKGACRVRRECPICRTKLGRPPYRPLYL